MPKHIVIFSHGFGVRKDSRGMFTDIAEALSPDTEKSYLTTASGTR